MGHNEDVVSTWEKGKGRGEGAGGREVCLLYPISDIGAIYVWTPLNLIDAL